MINLNKDNTRFSEKFQKSFKKLPENTRKIIKGKLVKILSGEQEGNIKKLKNYKLAQYRFKIRDYRLLFQSAQGQNLFILIKHRSELY